MESRERDDQELFRLQSELRILQGRLLELEQLVTGWKSPGSIRPAVPLNPAIWVPQRFWARVVADNTDGTYQVRRQVATAGNVFIDDDDDPSILTAANVSERTGYIGMYSLDDIVHVHFDGLDSENGPIYHIG